MKNMVVIFALLVIVSGCDKKSSDTDNSPFFKFTMDGNSKQWNGNTAAGETTGAKITLEDAGTPNPYYAIVGINGTCSNCEYLRMHIATGSLAVGQYTQVWALSYMQPSPNTYITYTSPVNFTVQITKIENGYANGTFSGVLDEYTGPTPPYPKHTVASGEFRHIKIVQ